MHRLLALVAVAFGPALVSAEPTSLERARALFEGHRPAEAQAAFEALAAADPQNPEVNYYLGQLANRRNEPEKALPHFEAAIAAAPGTGRYHHGLGDAYGRRAQRASLLSQFGLAKKCLAAYERAVALEPDNLEFRLSLFEYYRQAPGLAGGGFDLAAAQAAAIKRIDATRGRIAFATLYAGEKKYAEAFAQFDDVLQLNPDDYVALYQIGRLAALTGQQLDRGVAALRRCLAQPAPNSPHAPGHPAAHWRLGQLLEKKRDLAAARAAYTTAVDLDATFTPAIEALKKLR